MSLIETAPVAALPKTSRSRVTNGKALLAGIDGRSATARRFKDIAAAYAAELGPLTAMQSAMVKQAAVLTLEAESMQAALVRGEAVDRDAVVRLANALDRALRSLGLRPARAKPKGPNLAAYLAARKAAGASA